MRAGNAMVLLFVPACAKVSEGPRRIGRGCRPHRAGGRGETLVLSHLTPAIDSITDDTWRAPAAKYFKGEIVVGHDLMVV